MAPSNTWQHFHDRCAEIDVKNKKVENEKFDNALTEYKKRRAEKDGTEITQEKSKKLRAERKSSANQSSGLRTRFSRLTSASVFGDNDDEGDDMDPLMDPRFNPKLRQNASKVKNGESQSN